MVEAGEEEAGVDGAGDALAGSHRRHHGQTRNLGHVPGGQTSSRLGHQDDALWGLRSRHDARQGQVARSPQDGVVLALRLVGERRGRRGAVHHGHFGAGNRYFGEHEPTGDLDSLAVDRPGDAQQRCRNVRLVADQRGAVVAGGKHGEGGSNRRCPLAAPGSADGDDAVHLVPPVVFGLIGNINANLNAADGGGAGGAGRPGRLASTARPNRWTAAGFPDRLRPNLGPHDPSDPAAARWSACRLVGLGCALAAISAWWRSPR